MMDVAKLLIDGSWVNGVSTSTLHDRFRDEPIAEVAQASSEQVHTAVASAKRTQRTEPLDPYVRYEILARASELVLERKEALVATIVAESGFTVSDATGEVRRAADTLLLSAEEAKRITGETVPLDGGRGVRDRLGFTIRMPVGVVCAITPFNSPLNTVAHKVGPALAAGNSVVLKPASATPMTAVRLCELLIDAGLPSGYVSLLHGGGREVGTTLLEDEGIDFYSFTGSTEVGKVIQSTVGLRRTQLELGAISSTIVCDDAKLSNVVDRCVNAAFRKSGQVCTSIQRLYVDAGVVDEVSEQLIEILGSKQVGDPADPDTFVGPLISRSEAERVEGWVSAAQRDGARLLAGGGRTGAVVQPAVLTDVKPDMLVLCHEVFGPVVSIVPFTSLWDAVDEINGTPYGLSAGIFTNDVNRALRAAQRLHMGSVHINETSSSRVDLMPYAGVKDSGFGTEGPHYAVREMTEERLITIKVLDDG